MTSLGFLWIGFPDYAARCVRRVIDRGKYSVSVIATRPNVPIEGAEVSLGQPVTWVDSAARSVSWEGLGLPLPDIVFQGGYYIPAFNALRKQCRKVGKKIVLMSDQNWHGTLRQRTIDLLRHRLFIEKNFDIIFVPGASGEEFSRRMGYPPDCVFAGLYGADGSLFHGGPPLDQRSKTFIFIGQFVARKNCLGLAHAFLRFVATHPDWRLRMCGAGVQRDKIPEHPSILVSDFVQPPQLAEILRGARCLVLPSLDEHWGLVVHEAALSGCALALSDVVGAGVDLATSKNGVLFRPGSETQIEQALCRIAGWDSALWRTAEAASRQVARQFGPEPFADAVDRIVETFSSGAGVRVGGNR